MMTAPVMVMATLMPATVKAYSPPTGTPWATQSMTSVHAWIITWALAGWAAVTVVTTGSAFPWPDNPLGTLWFFDFIFQLIFCKAYSCHVEWEDGWVVDAINAFVAHGSSSLCYQLHFWA